MTASGLQDFKITTNTTERPWKGKRNNNKAPKKVKRPKNAVLPRPGRRIAGQTVDDKDAAICAQILQKREDRRQEEQRIRAEEHRVKAEEQQTKDKENKLVAQRQKEKEDEERKQREIERRGFQIPGLWSDAYSEQWFWAGTEE